jgi:hypothetical protein
MKTLRVDELHQINMICHSMARIMSVICNNRAAAYLCEALAGDWQIQSGDCLNAPMSGRDTQSSNLTHDTYLKRLSPDLTTDRRN